MNLENIQTSIQFELWIVPTVRDYKLTNSPVKLRTSGVNGEYNLIQNETLVKIHLRDKHQQNDIDFHLKRGCANLSKIIQTAVDGSALLKVNFFNGSVIEMGEVEVGIDERIETTAKRNGFKYRTIEDLVRLLSSRCLMYVGETDSESYFLIMAGAAADDDFDFVSDENNQPDTDKKDPTPKSPESAQEQMRCFSIYGDGLRIPVERRKIDKDYEIFFATKLIAKQDSNSEGSLRLAKGKFFFSDYTKTGRIRALASGSMSRLLQDKGSYLKKWDEYGAAEGKLLLARAKAVGKLEYNNTEQTAKGVKFFFNHALPHGLSEDDKLEITSEEPLYVRNLELTWEEYSSHLEEEFKSKWDYSKKPDKSKELAFAKIVSVDSNTLELELKASPSKDNFLILSINGDKTQIERRMKARKLILEGRSANPLLGLLIEEGGEIPEIQRITRLKPLTHFVRDKIFKYVPTDVQIKAIDTALNTPDIALIQGPPGTGKTTVITAILERLNEEHDKTKSIRGEVLVSGFQHDAVENIVSRLSVNALPAVKFGRKSGDSESTKDTVSKKIETFCKETAKKIRAKNPQIIQTEEQRKLSEMFFLYSNSPSKINARNLLNLILELPRNILTQELSDKTFHLLETLISEEDLSLFTGTNLLGLIRSLRISEEAFIDDGKEKAADIIENFENVLDESDRKALKKAIIWKDGKDLSFLKSLKKIKLKLLDLYAPKPQFRIEKPREDILELFAQISKQIKKHKTRANQTDIILADFLHELEDNPDGVREAIEDYNYVFAATTQYSGSKYMSNVKTKYRDEHVRYDTVIVDEAARTSPRDLLIPMAQAEKRIILVGDHRQLPHIINEDVVNDIMDKSDIEDNKSEQDYVTESMFAYLKRRLYKLSAKDGISRVITLDAQYRMHSLLGDFVSNSFYEPYGEGYNSPLREIDHELFTHNLKGTNNCAAAWLKVPNKYGKEERLPSRSRRRIVEAHAIADRLKEWIDSDEGKNLSFGVISFYKAQVYAVFEALSRHGITVKSSDGTWHIVDEYKFLKKEEDGKNKIEERLRIGTVDAFQGMEFDVVFLSIVRSQDMNNLPGYIKNESNYMKKQQKLFGHLMSENRLCVSMSRQKKLLILVGDSELMQTDIAKEAVTALGSYFELCSKEGVIL